MEHLKTLRDTISNVIEEMFFLVEETPPDHIVESYQYAVSVAGSTFSFQVLFGHDLAREITINFLGIDQEPDNHDMQDCLQEVVNMATGNFIGQVFPDYSTALPIPQCKPFTVVDDAGAQQALLFFRGRPLKVVYRG